MSQSTGPVLAGGALILFRDVIVNNKDIGSTGKVIFGTAVVGVLLGGVEAAGAVKVATALAWLFLAGVIFVPPTGGGQSPIEAFNSWYTSLTQGTS